MIRVQLTQTQDVQGFCRLLGLRQPLYNKDRGVYTTLTSGGLPVEIKTEAK